MPYIAYGRAVMRFACQVSREGDDWKLEHASEGVGPIQVSAPTREEARRQMEGEIRYWLEMCPCSGESMARLEIEIVEQPGGGG